MNQSGKIIPRHVAIIMDGNGRWAQKRHMPRHYGHKAGVDTVRRLIEYCVAEKDIDVLTLFAFSSENWKRPENEVSFLMELFLSSLRREIKRLKKNNVQLRIIGDINAFPESLQHTISAAEKDTLTNNGLRLVIAANYGGRWDITQATRAIAARVEKAELSVNEITPEMIRESMSLADLPEPDLFIRTGGEKRISNFLLWQLAYAELYFTDILWPDFNIPAFEDALVDFTKRQRRFGKTGDQIKSATTGTHPSSPQITHD